MRLPFAFAPLLLAACGVGQAQDDMSGVEIRTQPLAPGVAVLFGAGGNIGVSFGADGTIVIDDQFAQLTPKIVAALAALDKKPARFLINTHWHGDHSGGNANFAGAGTLIFAQDNVRARMSTDQFMKAVNEKVPASPAAALPVVTFADGMTFHLNGDTLRIVHVANAHTDGDAMVKWEKANILHTGDVFVRYGLPFIDRSSGGGIQGMIAGVDRALALSDDATKIIPGHGEVATRADMVAFRDMMVTIRDRVAAARAKGKTLAEIQALKPAAEWDKDPKAFVRGDAFVEAVYDSLEKPPA